AIKMNSSISKEKFRDIIVIPVGCIHSIDKIHERKRTSIIN
ncbi:unnamed protein product, partial [marine sediment metagenome]